MKIYFNPNSAIKLAVVTGLCGVGCFALTIAFGMYGHPLIACGAAASGTVLLCAAYRLDGGGSRV